MKGNLKEDKTAKADSKATVHNGAKEGSAEQKNLNDNNLFK